MWLIMVVAAGAFFTTYEAVKYTLGNTSTTTRAQRSNQSQHETINRLPVTQSHAYRPRDCVFVSGDGFLFDADTGGGAEAECAGGSNE